MKPLKLHELTSEQLRIVFDRFYNDHHAYGLLSSIHGYSFTELAQETRSMSEGKASFAIVTPTEIVAVLRLEHIDWSSRLARVYLAVHADVDVASTGNAIKTLLDTVYRFKGITRFYTYILALEQAEKIILSELGFQKEVCLTEHLYTQGSYQDLEIWGTERINLS